MPPTVWVFVASGAKFPGGVFGSVETAERWITSYSLTGVLTEYPLDIGAYDWAISAGYFKPKEADVASAFVGKFTSASMDHHHYEDGERA